MKKIKFSQVRNSLIQIGSVNMLTLSNWEMGTGSPALPAGTTWENLKADSTIRIRTKNLINVEGPCVISLTNKNYSFLVYLFDINQLYLGQAVGEILWRQQTLFLEEPTKYIAVLLRKTDNSELVVSDYLAAKLQVEKGNMKTDYQRSYKDFE